MATLQQQITEKFLIKLAESKKLDAEKIEQLRKLIKENKKVKASDFVKIFSFPAGGDLLSKAAEAAQSWTDTAAKEAAGKRKAALSTSNTALGVEQWAVNNAVHYNEWANFGRKDFTPVVASFKELLTCFRCETCDSWIYVAPRGTPEFLRCDCNAISLNLKSKK